MCDMSERASYNAWLPGIDAMKATTDAAAAANLWAKDMNPNLEQLSMKRVSATAIVRQESSKRQKVA